jgi:glycosyltransferase involved in cell wall biosynthesis
MNQKQDLILFSITRWDQPNPGSSASLTKELSKHYRVFFVERPYSLRDLIIEWGSFALKKRLKAIIFGIDPYLEINTGVSKFVVISPNLVLPLHFLPKGFIYHFFNAVNNYIVSRSIKKAIKHFQIKDFIYLNNFNPVVLPIFKSKKFKPALNIYYITNDIRLSRYFAKHGERAQEKAIQETDLVLVSSRHQFKKLFYKQVNMYYFPNAVDYLFFESVRTRPLVQPYDLATIGNIKVIMFCGFISQIRIDYLLVKAICENFHQYLIVLVGTYEEQDLINHKLEQIPNLLILGNRRYESIPSYLQTATVTIIPYLCNELNESVYPLKLNEYLAMGKPVVTTNFSTDLEAFSDVIYIANTYEDFLNYIEKAITEDSEARVENRLNYARLNTWVNRVLQLKDIISKQIR